MAALVEAARRRFATDGFDAVGLNEIAADAQVTTGAIYHHFEGKRGLFLAVAERIEQDLLESARAVDVRDPWDRFVEAFLVLLDACATQEVQRIIFLDAPRVIGPAQWREVELKYAYGAMSAGLDALLKARLIRAAPAELLAPILLSILAEASRTVAHAPTHRRAARDLVRWLLLSLRRERP